MDEDTRRDRILYATPKGLCRKLSGKKDWYPTKLRKAVSHWYNRSENGTEEAIPFTGESFRSLWGACRGLRALFYYLRNVTLRGDLFCLVAFFFQNGAFPFIFGEFPQRIAVLHLLMVSILKRVYIDLSISHKAIPAVVGENPPDCRDCFYLDYPKAFSVS